MHTYTSTYTQCICALFSFLGSTAGRQNGFLVGHQGCFWSAHVNAMFMFGLGPDSRGP